MDPDLMTEEEIEARARVFIPEGGGYAIILEDEDATQ
jgi:hypothetical protein